MREVEIRPAEIHAEYLRLSAIDAQTYFSDPCTLAHRSCPACAANAPVYSFSKNGFSLVRCADCDTLYVNPCPTAEALVPFYRASPSSTYWARTFFPAVAEARRKHIFRPRVRRVLETMRDLGRPLHSIVEVGAGAAIFLEEMRSACPDAALRAVEPGTDLAAQCQEKGFITYAGFAEDAAQNPGWAGKADLVVCFEVIEHTPDPLAFLQALISLAGDKGTVLVTGLSGDGFDIRVLGKLSNAVAPPHHLTFLSIAGVRSLFRRAGLSEVSVETPGELDVDIVANALRADSDAVSDSFLRRLLTGPEETPRRAFQAFLKGSCLSSHMWAHGRR